jgi:tungstate transport system substrate-binding protein
MALTRADGGMMKTRQFSTGARTLARAGLAVLVVLPFLGGAANAEDKRPVVRLAVVNTPYQSGLLAALLPEFEKTSGYRVEVYGGSDIYEQAESGKVDLLISHYGKAPVEQFVTSGKGAWPRPVFSNQAVLVGPKGDPAMIRGMTDPIAAMKKIIASGSPFLATSNAGERYLTELLLAGAGNPQRGAWYLATDKSKGRAMAFAEEKGAYTIWGSFPFERFRRKHATGLEVMVWDTPIFQRVMATIVVNPGKFPGVNVQGARALEAYLLTPAAQAAVAAFREEGLDRQTWWPAGRDNNPAQLLGLTGKEADE